MSPHNEDCAPRWVRWSDGGVSATCSCVLAKVDAIYGDRLAGEVLMTIQKLVNP